MRAAGYKQVRVRFTREGAIVEADPAKPPELDTPDEADEPEKVFVC